MSGTLYVRVNGITPAMVFVSVYDERGQAGQLTLTRAIFTAICGEDVEVDALKAGDELSWKVTSA